MVSSYQGKTMTFSISTGNEEAKNIPLLQEEKKQDRWSGVHCLFWG
jgi:hypothetical protein